ncbi:MAG: FecR family protein [Brevinematia bacterium]
MRSIIFSFLILLAFTAFSFAQVDQYPYVEIAIGDVQYAVSGDKSQTTLVYKQLESGKSIPLYSVIRTGADGYAEIKLAPNKTIKLYEYSTISLEKFQSDSTVQLNLGKVRVNFKKTSSFDELKVKTETGIAAVRGTDFGVIYSKGQGGLSFMEVLVKEGVVNLSTIDGKNVDVPAGFSSTINSYLGNIEIDDPKKISEEDFNKYFSEPQNLQQLPQQEQKTQDQKQEEKQIQPKLPVAPQGEPKPEQPSEPSEPKFNLGWEISAENINGTVWNKILLSPIFRIGKFGVGLYLVGYWDGKNNIYNTTKWYNSQEYDFGFYGNTFSITDFADDLFKKILFLSYGSKGDKVFIRIGNIPDITLGHGFIMDRYSNMLNFPAIRRIGLQFDLDFGYYGFETAVADLSRSRIIGMRHYVRPLYGTFLLGNIALGVSGVVDLEPYSVSNQVFEGNPSVFFVGADVDFPVVDVGVFSLTIFGDVAKGGIYINDLNANTYLISVFTNKGFNQGFNLLPGEGISAGVKGGILGIIPYRIEYRRTTGQFVPSYFDTLYDIQRTIKLTNLITFTPPTFNGILGSAGVSISNVVDGYIGYEQLWPSEDFSGYSVNRLWANLKISKDLVKMIAGIPSYGVLKYQRNNIPSFNVFFEDVLKDSVVSLEIAYSVDPTVDILLTYKRFYLSSTEYQDSVGIQLRSSIFGEIGM